jgi:hypothetical protein
VAVAVLAWPLFLLLPRFEGAEWEPLARFAARRPAERTAVTGFSDEIDLNRTGRLSLDDSLAFRVVVVDTGTPRSSLPGDQRWRGIVLDRYEERQGIWRSELSWPAGAPLTRTFGELPAPAAGEMLLQFEVTRRSGGLVLADPVRLSVRPGDLPIRRVDQRPDSGRRRGRPPALFFEAGGTAMPLSYLTDSEYLYNQLYDHDGDRGRYPAVRLPENYLHKLINCRVPDARPWTIALLRRLAVHPPVLPELRDALEGSANPGWCLPPGLWEPAARRLTFHLARSGEYNYSLTQRREVRELDPTMDFLINVREGACERYATGLALMLRSVGIPSRIVKGFRGAEYRGGGVYEVRQSQAHAWVEAVVPAREGQDSTLEWITLDATPAVDGPGSWASWLQQQQGRASDVWRDLVVGYGARKQAYLWEELSTGRLLFGAAPPLILATGLFVLLRLWRRRKRLERGRTDSGAAGLLYDRLLDLIRGTLGVRSRPEQTPRELADVTAELLRQQAATAPLAGIPGRVVELLYRVRWGGQAPDETELADLGQQLDLLRQAVSSSPS